MARVVVGLIASGRARAKAKVGAKVEVEVEAKAKQSEQNSWTHILGHVRVTQRILCFFILSLATNEHCVVAFVVVVVVPSYIILGAQMLSACFDWFERSLFSLHSDIMLNDWSQH